MRTHIVHALAAIFACIPLTCVGTESGNPQARVLFRDAISTALVIEGQNEQYSCASGPSLSIPFRESFLSEPEHPVYLRWRDVSDCIDVSYDSSMAVYAGDIHDAMDLYHEVSCTSICFGSPVYHSREPDIESMERRVHFTISDSLLDPDTSQPATDWHMIVMNTHTIYEARSGFMVSALITANANFVDRLGRTTIAHALGHVLGMGHSPDGTESMMNPWLSETPTEDRVLQAIDIDALCTMYGEVPYCQ